jgi:hypothetical protein
LTVQSSLVIELQLEGVHNGSVRPPRHKQDTSRPNAYGKALAEVTRIQARLLQTGVLVVMMKVVLSLIIGAVASLTTALWIMISSPA